MSQQESALSQHSTTRHPRTKRGLVLLSAIVAMLSGCISTVETSNSAVTATSAGTSPESAAAEISSTHPLFELRTYTTNPGKLDALHARFRNHTRAMFEKHGIKNVAYWTPQETPNTLIYIIAHQNKESAAASWKAFVADPAWQAVYQASIADGRLVSNIDSQFLRATDYSPSL